MNKQKEENNNSKKGLNDVKAQAGPEKVWGPMKRGALGKTEGLVFHGCCDKLPQTYSLETMQIWV